MRREKQLEKGLNTNSSIPIETWLLAPFPEARDPRRVADGGHACPGLPLFGGFNRECLANTRVSKTLETSLRFWALISVSAVGTLCRPTPMQLSPSPLENQPGCVDIQLTPQSSTFAVSDQIAQRSAGVYMHRFLRCSVMLPRPATDWWKDPLYLLEVLCRPHQTGRWVQQRVANRTGRSQCDTYGLSQFKQRKKTKHKDRKSGLQQPSTCRTIAQKDAWKVL